MTSIGEAAETERNLAALWEKADYVTPLTLRAVSDLGVADRLADGPLPVRAIAAAVGADEDALRRALQVLAGQGIFAAGPDDTFAHTPMSALLRSDHPCSARETASLHECDIRAWSEVMYSLRTGLSAFEHVYGTDRWSYFDEHAEEGRRFNARMRSASRRIGRALAESYPWTGSERVVDVGGGNGGLLRELLVRHPSMTGHLYDQPSVVADAAEVLDGVADRCVVEGGDFFAGVPAGGDVYTLVNVAHDWPDQRALELLKVIAPHIGDETRLLVVEGVPGHDGAASRSGALDMHMLVVWGGKERTYDQWSDLLAQIGLIIRRTFRAGPRVVLECGR
ncbi:methyltransferase [Nonomuraea sp. NPDC050451]|uniref:methyltransferase n=1 Tax=Nonomuraea sp. NPDC050451 TaxID=3364364 RepID=UPI003789B64A